MTRALLFALAFTVTLGAQPGRQVGSVDRYFENVGRRANQALARADSQVRMGAIEWLTARHEMGSTVFFSDRGNRRLGHDFVPFDPRRLWSPGPAITYLVDSSDGATGSGLTDAETRPAIMRAMRTWDLDTVCSTVPIIEIADTGVDPDLADFLFGFGPPPHASWPFADIVHGGWTPAFPPPVIGVTFTFIWVDGGGNPTDIDNDGQLDVALREIYYSDNFVWQVDGEIDVETVALHEAGHGLSQAHFGTLFRTDANGRFHFAPRAVMNAGYTGQQQDLAPTDLAGHCSLWGSWPVN